MEFDWLLLNKNSVSSKLLFRNKEFEHNEDDDEDDDEEELKLILFWFLLDVWSIWEFKCLKSALIFGHILSLILDLNLFDNLNDCWNVDFEL